MDCPTTILLRFILQLLPLLFNGSVMLFDFTADRPDRHGALFHCGLRYEEVPSHVRLHHQD